MNEKPLSYNDLAEIEAAAMHVTPLSPDEARPQSGIFIPTNNVKKVNGKMTKAKPLQVGDRIKITNDSVAHGFEIGSIVTVEEIDEDNTVRATNENGTLMGVVESDYVRVRKSPAKKQTPVVPMGKIEQHQIIGQDTNKAILKVGIDKDLPVLLIGETGTGKTSIIREQAIDSKADWVRFNLTGETTVDEFVGKYELENGQTVWRDGVLLDAMKKGRWLIVDEINVALPEILFVLHSLLDDDKMVTVASHTGEVVKPHKNFRFFATMNPTDEYAGTKELNKAFQSRFSIVLVLHYPTPAVEAKIIADKTGVDLADATKMADVAVALRKAKADEKIFYTCSTRDLLHWGNLCEALDPGEAFRVSILNKSNGDSQAILDIYTHIIKRYISLEQPEVELTVDWFEGQAKKIIEDRKKFEAEKDETRRQITQEIITKLTSGDVPTPKKDGEADKNAILGEVFNDKPF